MDKVKLLCEIDLQEFALNFFSALRSVQVVEPLPTSSAPEGEVDNNVPVPKVVWDDAPAPTEHTEPCDAIIGTMERTEVKAKPKPKPEVKPSGRRDAWTAADDALVRKYYGKMPTEELAGTLGRSTGSVTKRAVSMGVKFADGKAVKEAEAASKPSKAKPADTDLDPDTDPDLVPEDCIPESFAEGQDARSRALKLAAKHGARAMQGTPVQIDSKTIVIKKK